MTAQEKDTAKGADVVALIPQKKAGEAETHEAGTDALAKAGVDFSTHVPWQDMKLPEVGYGETTIRDLTDEESAIYYEMWQTRRHLDDMERTVIGGALKTAGETIAQSDRDKPMHELVQDGAIMPDFENAEQAEKYFGLSKRMGFLYNTFHWRVGEAQSDHTTVFGVRVPAKGANQMRLVSVRKRYEGTS